MLNEGFVLLGAAQKNGVKGVMADESIEYKYMCNIKKIYLF